MPKKPHAPRPQDPEDYPQAEPFPEGFATWTQEQVDAWGIGLLRELEAHVYTEEELAAAAHFSAKQESARTVPQGPSPEDGGHRETDSERTLEHGEEEDTERHGRR